MKPLKLTLTNFGPYVAQTFDFERLRQVPLFLITGKTGSGKTTIFDGLTFALYGETASEDRSAASLRSDFADPQSATTVTLEFEHQDRRYRIYRAPKQTLAKKRSHGLREMAAVAKLEIFAGDEKQAEITKVRDVNLKIAEILQLNRQQFVQIVLLPQGDFRRFLMSDSNEKEAILRKIFQTQLYQRWGETLHDYWKTQQKEITQQQTAIEQAFKRVNWKTDSVALENELPTADQLKLLKVQQTADQADLQQLEMEKQQATTKVQVQQNKLTAGQKLNQQFVEFQQQQQKLVDLKQQQTAMEQQTAQIKLLEWAQQQQPLFSREQELIQRRQAAEKKLKAARLQQDKWQQEFEQLQQQAADLTDQQLLQKQREKEQILLSQQKDQFEKAAKIQQQLQAKTHHVQQLTAEIQTQQAALAKLTEKLTQIDQLQETLPELLRQQSQFKQQKLQLQQFKEQLVVLQNRQQTNQIASVDLEKLQTELGEAKQLLSSQQTNYQQLHDLWLNNQIAVLAAQLSPEAPCPVCGSLTHPHPAVVTTGKPISKAQLSAAEKSKNQAQATVNSLTALITEKQQAQIKQTADLKQAEQDLIQQLQQLKYLSEPLAELTELTKLVKEQLNKCTTALADVTQQLTDKQQLINEKSQLKKQQTDIQQNLTALQTKFQTENDQQQRLSASLAEIRQGLPAEFADLAALTAHLTDLQQAIAGYQQKVQQNQQQSQQLQQHLASGVSLAEQTETDLTALNSQWQNTAQQLDMLLKEQLQTTNRQPLERLLQQLDQLPHLRQQQTDYYQQLAALKAQVAAQQKLLQDQQPLDLEQATQTLRQLQQQLTVVTDQYQALYDRQLLNGSLLTEITKGQQAIQQQQTAISQLAQLVTAVSGHSEAKLGLERYVLRQQLIMILQAANQHLQQLSSGRYWLRLHQERGNTLANTGLEIDVYDDHVGQVRSVHTLSGGESFIAALSLALALGEIIQEQAGGVSIDTLFVDEGFGSLDRDSLITALAALENIESGSRMIGIISHVELLRAQIPYQLQITQQGQGQSQAKMVIRE